MVIWKTLLHWIMHIFKQLSLLISPPSLSEKFLHIGKLSGSQLQIQIILWMVILFECLNFSTGNKYHWLFFLKWLACFYSSFEKISVKYPSLSHHSFSVSGFLKWKWYSVKRAAISAYNSNIYLTSAFLQDNSTLEYRGSAF